MRWQWKEVDSRKHLAGSEPARRFSVFVREMECREVRDESNFTFTFTLDCHLDTNQIR